MAAAAPIAPTLSCPRWGGRTRRWPIHPAALPLIFFSLCCAGAVNLDVAGDHAIKGWTYDYENVVVNDTLYAEDVIEINCNPFTVGSSGDVVGIVPSHTMTNHGPTNADAPQPGTHGSVSIDSVEPDEAARHETADVLSTRVRRTQLGGN